MYLYLKALHIIFIVTWFAGLFYIVRLFVYNAEAALMEEPRKSILQKQYTIMSRRLWYGITWPSAIITLVLGSILLFQGGWHKIIFEPEGRWLLVKLSFVIGLYFYHFSLHHLFKQQASNIFRYSSSQLRIWNEVATIFLVAIVILVSVKQTMSWLWGIIGLAAFIIILMAAIKIYKVIRLRN